MNWSPCAGVPYLRGKLSLVIPETKSVILVAYSSDDCGMFFAPLSACAVVLKVEFLYLVTSLLAVCIGSACAVPRHASDLPPSMF